MMTTIGFPRLLLGAWLWLVLATCMPAGVRIASVQPCTAGSDGCSAVPCAAADANCEAASAIVIAPTPQLFACNSDGLPHGRRLLRRLTGTEFNNSVRAMLGRSNAPAATFFSDLPVYAFANNADALGMGGALPQALMLYAESLATFAAANSSSLVSCPTQNEACATAFIDRVGSRAFRRPLRPEETQALQDLFAQELANTDFSTAIGVTVGAMVQFPGFLYRSELGVQDAANPNIYNLTAYEVATELSYFFTQSSPDDTLWQAATDGQLTTPGQIETQARRLLTGANATLLSPFIFALLRVDALDNVTRDATTYPAFNDAIKQAMLKETSDFLQATAYAKNSNFAALFTTPASTASAALQQYYGGDVSTRAPGLLGQGSVLTMNADAAHSSPVLRGKLIRERLFCKAMPPPPPNLDTSLHLATSAKTTRELYQAHAANATCAACHNLMDPVGFGLENFDATGRFRSQENGIDVDASGTIKDIWDTPKNFAGAAELAGLVGQSDVARACFATNLMIYGFGLTSWEQNGCTQDELIADAALHADNVQEALLSITRSTNFRRRGAN